MTIIIKKELMTREACDYEKQQIIDMINEVLCDECSLNLDRILSLIKKEGGNV